MQLLPHNEKGELRFFFAKTVLYDKIELKAIARSTWQPLPGLLPCHPHTLVKSLQLIWSSDTRIGNIFRHRWLLRRLGACKINFKCVSMTYKELGSFFKTLRPGQSGRHFADDIFQFIVLNENIWTAINNMLLNFVPKDPINNIPLSELMMSLVSR